MEPGFETAPALAARWRHADGAAALAAAWRAHGGARLDDALAPGLAAELAAVLAGLPLEPLGDAGEVSWQCDVVVPPQVDPQLAEPLYRAVRLVERDLPTLLAASLGLRVAPATPRRLTVAALRKGSWLDGGAPGPGELAVTVVVAAGSWPAAWGGHDAWVDAAGAIVAAHPPAAGAVELRGPGLRRRTPPLRRHVERLELRAVLREAP